MDTDFSKKRIAIIGGGPAGLFIYKRLIESGSADFSVTIFELYNRLGAGMPYSEVGANKEHVTNVSGNEIPELVTTVAEWILTIEKEKAEQYNINPQKFNDYKILPRLLFGDYLAAQFDLLLAKAEELGIETTIKFNSGVTDIKDQPATDEVMIEVAGNSIFVFDLAIICIGHRWPGEFEGKIAGYFDSPYPPAKLSLKLNHRVAIKGSSLTAIDAIKTLSRSNGTFNRDSNGFLSFSLNEGSTDFRIILHSRSGLLPAVRFHLEDSHLSKKSLLSREELMSHRQANDGFIDLDYVFEKNFKEQFRKKEPGFFERIKSFSIEEFVASVMDVRESVEPFRFLKAEYTEAEKSIRRKQSVYWKELLATLSFAMNYPAKYLSAEDMQRLQKVLMPLISIVIAFVPQGSAEELIVLHEAGILDIIPVGADSSIEPVENGNIVYHYKDDNDITRSVSYSTFIDCVGQPHLSYRQFPFRSLLAGGTVSPAKLEFKSRDTAQKQIEEGNVQVVKDVREKYYLNVPGVAINDNFQFVDEFGACNERLYMMAVPYIGGYNPDYSGLDFCEEASKRIIENIIRQRQLNHPVAQVHSKS